MNHKRLDKLIAEIMVDAYGDDEQFSAFRQVIEDEVELPAEGFVIGEPARLLRSGQIDTGIWRPVRLLSFNRESSGDMAVIPIFPERYNRADLI